MDDLETKFNENLKQWKEHCGKSINYSMATLYLDCDAYRNIVAMGKDVLPLIREVYDMDSKNDCELKVLQSKLVNLVKKIVGDEFKIPEWMKGRVTAIEKYTAKWLDENMDKYMRK